MNLETEIKNKEYKLEQMEPIVKTNLKDVIALRTKYNLAKKKLFSQLKFFSSLTIEEIMANDEHVEDKQTQMDSQLKKIKEYYEKYVSLGQLFEQKQEASTKIEDEYAKAQQELEELEEKLAEDEIPVSSKVVKFGKKKKL